MELTKELLYNLYIVQDKSERAIGEVLDIGKGKVDYWIRKWGFNFKKSDPDRLFNLKHIDSKDPIFCYYAGLIATDGYLDYKNKRISLRCNNEGSKEVFEAIRQYFEYLRPNRMYTNKSVNRPNNDITIPNNCIFEELKSMGIYGKKDNRTFSLDWYISADDNCKRMFLRGVLDGDGNIHKKTGIFRIAMKSDSFIENLLYIFNKKYNDSYEKKFQGNSATTYKYPAIFLRKKDSLNFYSFIYTGFDTFRFTDKYNRYMSKIR